MTHTGRVGTAQEIATRQREDTARALREAAAIYYDRRKTLLAGGDEAAMAEAVYKDTPLQALGVSLAQFQARLQAGQEPASAAGARVRAGAVTTGARFYMPMVYSPDPAWAQIMEQAAQAGLRALQDRPATPLDSVIQTMISVAKPGLILRAAEARSYTHAKNYGAIRTTPINIQGGIFLDFFTLSVNQALTLGEYSESFPPDADRQETYRVQFSHQRSDREVKLGSLRLDVIFDGLTSSSQRKIEYNASSPRVFPQAIVFADEIFDQVKAVKKGIDSGALAKDEGRLRQVIDHAAEIYWILSQAWPFYRGSSSIADLSTKVIFDWLGIEVPLFKTDVYPNINALLSPIETFRKEYASFFQGEFRWLP